ncbi:FkbM family methyltransferase [Polymorphum gilvum]|uniref:Methyltransferase FkbM family n=1 Tax=Polymorphum gilvum (strain LMG 25793 / CGMCC 1.9160 / SL003B-26A1) TaxID=991905 RepID=F2J5C4_POLGS|nr:FkbM family methyltransferase [Polymorphum gilvum]ADZ71183.1 Methyltransferase FkbM family [Polymorphum gilvum SL003B-26A1]
MGHYKFQAHGFGLSGLSENDSYVRHVIAQPEPEPHLLNFLRAHYKADESYVFADIGANIGFTALLMARMFPNAAIHAFEPGPNIFGLLRKNTARTRIVPVNAAVSDRPGKVAFVESSAYGHMVPGSSNASTDMVSLSSYAQSKGIEKFDFVKVDVEGFERDVFRGLNGKADVVFFEFNTFTLAVHSRVNPVDLLEELHKDWDLYEFVKVDWLEPVTEYAAVIQRNVLEHSAVTDLVAVRKGRVIRQDIIDPAILWRQIADMEAYCQRIRERLSVIT